MRCLITGASGFVGRALVPHLRACEHAVLFWPREPRFDLACADNKSPPSIHWITRLRDIDAVVHLAGLAHQPRNARDAEQYFRLNRDGTLQLAAAARAAGVRRFIFLSSAKIFGEGGKEIYSAATHPAPCDAYAQSKWQAEQLLVQRFSQQMEIVILRPPLVYGRNAKANFANLTRLAQLPLPLPFGGIDNRRAMLGIDNLADLIERCLTAPAAAGKTFICADARHYSLADIIASIRRAANRSPFLFSLPSPLLKILEAALGPAMSMRLFGDFQMDCSDTYATLGWRPPYTMEQILRGGSGAIA